MQRRGFVAQVLGSGVVWRARAGGMARPLAAMGMPAEWARVPEVVIEPPLTGKPHSGKVLAAIQPHADDIPFFAAGTVAKLVGEGYTGHLIRTSNDEKAGSGTVGETILNNERDNDAVAKALGLEKVFSLEYRNHEMDGIAREEMRERLIFLIRLLKIDTIICYDPWGT